jgi:hypothetical protein
VNDESHIEAEAVKTVSTVTKPATCEAKGETTYTATFTNTAFETQTKTVETPATGHDWGMPTYEWSADNSTVTATRVCANDESHIETETVSAIGNVTKPATYTEAGVKTWTSATFENAAFEVQTKMEEIPVLAPSHIMSTSVTFEGKLYLNIYVVLSEEVKADPEAYVSVTFNGETTDHKVVDLPTDIKDGVTRVKVSQEVYAAMMHDEMTLTVHNGDGEVQELTNKENEDVTNGFVYAAYDYLEACQVSDKISQEMKDLANAAELYETAVQKKFNYKPGQLDDEDIQAMEEAAAATTIPDTYEEIVSGTMPEGITKRTKTVMFEADNSLRMYFYFDDANLSRYTFAIDGEEVAPVKKASGRYYVEKSNIASGELSKVYTFSVSDGTDECIIRLSALGYAYALQEQSSDVNMVNLAKMLYLYSQAADAYFTDN